MPGITRYFGVNGRELAPKELAPDLSNVHAVEITTAILCEGCHRTIRGHYKVTDDDCYLCEECADVC